MVELREGPTRGHLTHTIPPATRRAVLHRDDFCCRVPGCTNRLYLDIHHADHRAHGGTHDEDNLLTVCSIHHGLAHDGRLGIERVPDGFEFWFANGRIVVMPVAPPRDRWSGGLLAM